MRIRLILGTISLALAPLALAQPKAAEPVDPVQKYLNKLGLSEYELLHLESELVRVPEAKREPIAKTLANLYADVLLDTDSPEAAEALQKKAQTLLTKYPSVRTPQLEVILLQSDFHRAEALLGKWLFDPDDAASKAEAVKILARIAPSLQGNANKLEGSLIKAQGEVDRMKDGPEKKIAQSAVDKLGQQFGRAGFFGGWSYYYLGVLNSEPRNSANFRKAREEFLRLMPFETPENDTDPDEIGLGSSVRARAVLGFALGSAATDDLDTAKLWFDLLRKPAVAESVRSMVDFWQVFALVQAGQSEEAVAFARSRVNDFDDTATTGKRNFCILLVQLGGRDAGGPRAPLAELGVRGLVLTKQTELAKKTAEKYKVMLGGDTPAGRILDALLLLDAADKSQKKPDFQTAAEAFAKVVADAEKSKDTGLLNRSRYQLGYSLARAEDWAAAMKELEQAAPALKSAKSETAADAAWLLIVVYEKLHAKDPQVRVKLIDALRTFPIAFPAHPKARAAGTLLVAVEGVNLDLSKLNPADPDYPEKLLLVTKKLYGQWRTVKDDGTKAPGAASEVAAAADLFLALPDDKAMLASRLDAAFMAADAMLTGQKPDPARALGFIKKAEPLVAGLPLDARAAGDFRILQVQYAQQTGDLDMARAAAAWLGENRAGTPLHEAGLVSVAKVTDARLAAAKPAERAARAEETLAAYQALADQTGPTAEKVKASRNAQVANSRLVALCVERGKLDLAKKVLEERLLPAYPKEGKYLRLAGLVYFQLQENEKGLECWRLLTVGLPAGSAGWHEAKYHHMATLNRVNKGDARIAFTQFKSLYPDYGPPEFRERYKQLEQEVAK